MRVVALISGGKDSTFNILCCQNEGHQIVALANLHPADKDELDSYMYQTVGHMGIEKFAEAMELPLYRRTTSGLTAQKGKYYEPIDEDDEVEDLYQLLKEVKEKENVDAVAIGAIFSDYQRVRGENVCSRLNLQPLAYLWRRDQAELLQEMIDCQIDAIIIKVASLGLTPERHLGKSIRELQGHLTKMHEKYGLNVCGEGGEYETFTLDCPLFKKKIVVDDNQVVISSSDPVCPVGYINFTKLRLVQKQPSDYRDYVIKTSLDFISELNSSSYSDLSDPDLTDTELEFIEKDNFGKFCGTKNQTGTTFTRSQSLNNAAKNNSMEEQPLEEMKFEYETAPLKNETHLVSNSKGWHWISSIQGEGDSTYDGINDAMRRLDEIIQQYSLKLNDICYITLYVRRISDYAVLNDVYSKKLNFQNPPTRVCVETCLPEGCHVIMEALAFKTKASMANEADYRRQTMHVQGISHWSPANIGPYSQATRIGEITYISGQIGLIPGNMTLITGGIRQECKLTLRHINRVAKAMSSHGQLRDVVQGICFLTHPNYITEARRQWERRSANAIMDYIVVPALPRKALVEWQVWIHTHNNKFEYEETGCSINNQYVLSIRRRWNYENNCASIICYVSTGQTTSSTKLTDLTEEVKRRHDELTNQFNESHIIEVMKYVLGKIMQGYPTNSENVPGIHFRVFYQVSQATPSAANLIIKTLRSFKESTKTANIAFTVIPACYLQNFGTFISICGVRHE